MFWRLIDKDHPMYDNSLATRYGKAIENIYLKMDRFLAMAMKKVDKNTILIVMSDHGFTPFRRSFNLNTWLKENGYLNLINKWRQGQQEFFLNTDWSRTKAYAYGINSLYINQEGRERDGIVKAGVQREALVREIAQKLEKVKDPKTGERVVLRAYLSQDIYHGPYIKYAPDIIVGYNRGYRASWATPLGRIPKNIIEDNTEKWSGDHCMDPSVIPGILFINRKIKAESPALHDLTPTILSIFGIKKPEEMIGNSVL